MKHGQLYSDKFSNETLIRSLSIADRCNRLQGDMSTLGSHMSPSRKGPDHLKAGIELDNLRAPQVLGEFASIILFALRVTCNALGTFLDIVLPRFALEGSAMTVKIKLNDSVSTWYACTPLAGMIGSARRMAPLPRRLTNLLYSQPETKPFEYRKGGEISVLPKSIEVK